MLRKGMIRNTGKNSSCQRGHCPRVNIGQGALVQVAGFEPTDHLMEAKTANPIPCKKWLLCTTTERRKADHGGAISLRYLSEYKRTSNAPTKLAICVCDQLPESPW